MLAKRLWFEGIMPTTFSCIAQWRRDAEKSQRESIIGEHHAKAQSSQEMQFNAISRRGAEPQRSRERNIIGEHHAEAQSLPAHLWLVRGRQARKGNSKGSNSHGAVCWVNASLPPGSSVKGAQRGYGLTDDF